MYSDCVQDYHALMLDKPSVPFRHTTMKEKQNFVHLNLCIALLLGCIIFVGGLETAKDNKVSLCIIYTYLSKCGNVMYYKTNICTMTLGYK